MVTCERPMIVGVASTTVVGRGMVLCSTKMIAGVARLIVSAAETIESLTGLITERMEILLSQPATITDDVDIIVEETESVVTTVSSKGKTGGEKAGERVVSDEKQSACWVGFVVLPFMPPNRASGIPYQTDRLSRIFNGLDDGTL